MHIVLLARLNLSSSLHYSAAKKRASKRVHVSAENDVVDRAIANGGPSPSPPPCYGELSSFGDQHDGRGVLSLATESHFDRAWSSFLEECGCW